ncbi:hypothetical protein [Novosphingobium capsulatum]|uniref:hypothetical protein n=1 Tax=Novosphingobium capsulatum TaxID=13688 RepID=UPI00078686BE|nr:hypothetical protein [Novosphingobium capsulatum]WQD94194.1 hypothetical protein U0041_06315 [Novosphingobium capsulatum]
MIALDDNARRTITNARALLDAMLAGGWQQVCLQSAEGDFFLARSLGTPNPLLAPAPVVAPAVPPPPPAVAAQACTIRAPHVGTVAWLLPIGSQPGKGDAVARLAVLDTLVDVPAPLAGVVVSHGMAANDLAEYGTILLGMEG